MYIIQICSCEGKDEEGVYAGGKPVQHLQYLPFGEPYVNQHPAGYQERFTFTGKERDEETVYGKFDPILNNMPFANRQQIRYGEKSGFLGILETLVQSILPAHHDLSSPQRISIKDYKKDNELVNTILKRK